MGCQSRQREIRCTRLSRCKIYKSFNASIQSATREQVAMRKIIYSFIHNSERNSRAYNWVACNVKKSRIDAIGTLEVAAEEGTLEQDDPGAVEEDIYHGHAFDGVYGPVPVRENDPIAEALANSVPRPGDRLVEIYGSVEGAQRRKKMWKVVDGKLVKRWGQLKLRTSRPHGHIMPPTRNSRLYSVT
ncbi:MAG: hypothetical protein MMC23_007822 [Stictis urceolatum]|nr:hypothetical protein [Stictis urceolata]